MSAVFLPPLIHMLARRREKRMVFSSVVFLKEVARKTHSLSRITTLLLLLLRMLFIFFFVLFLSSPVLVPAKKKAAQERSAVAIVLDSSASMMRKNNKLTLFDEAKNLIESKLLQLPKDVPVSLFLAKNPPVQKQIFLSQPASVIHDALRLLKPSYTKSHITQTLRMAARYLEAQELPSKEIIIFSDFQKTDFVPDELRALPKNIHLTLVRLAHDNPDARENMRLTINAKRENFYKDAPASFDISFKAFGKKSAGVNGHENVPVKVYLNERPLLYKKTAGASLTFTPEKPGYYCLQAKSAGDGFALDNIASYCFHARGGLKALVISDGTASMSPKNQSYYVAQALKAAKSSSILPLDYALVSPDEITLSSLTGADTVIISGVASLAENLLSKLMKHVSSGHGMIVFLGDSIDADFYRAKLLPHFNITLRHPVALPSAVFSAAGSGELLFQNLPAGNFQNAFSLKFFKAWEIGANEPARPGALYNHNLPAIIQSRYKNGKVVVVNTSPTPVFSNLVLSSAFVPLLINMLRFTSPYSGEKLNVSSDERDEKPGIYWKNTKGVAVNLPPEESMPVYDADELYKIFQGSGVFQAADYLSAERVIPSRELSRVCLLFACLIFACETWLSSRTVMEPADKI